MTIKSLELYNFRNYEKQIICFDEGINILFGQNAQGKTNILEALYIAATGKSHRSKNYRDIVQHNKNGFEVKLDALVINQDTSISIKYTLEKGRFAEVNGIKRDKISDILGTLNMIMFSPETLDVVKGSPQIRRKFIDILLCQTNRRYLYYLQQYNILIKNKSLALKKGRADKKFEDIIPIWNDHIAKYGGKIAYIRMMTIEKLDGFMKNEISQITNGKEESELHYKTYFSYKSDMDSTCFEETLKNVLQKELKKEKDLSQCLIGPHRDDFEILLNGLSSRQYCSQGQQRTLALSLILSELYFVEAIKGEKPVLLLDDVMSELDVERQEYLIIGLKDVQTIITATDELPYSGIKDKPVKRMYVENGTVFT